MASKIRQQRQQFVNEIWNYKLDYQRMVEEGFEFSNVLSLLDEMPIPLSPNVELAESSSPVSLKKLHSIEASFQDKKQLTLKPLRVDLNDSNSFGCFLFGLDNNNIDKSNVSISTTPTPCDSVLSYPEQ